MDIPEDEGSDSDIDDGQQARPHHPRHTQISGRGGARFIGSMRGGDSEETEDSEIDVDDDDEDDDEDGEEDEEENEDLDEDNDSLEGSSGKPGRTNQSLHPQILEESDNDF